MVPKAKAAAEQFLQVSRQPTVMWQQQQDFENSPSSHRVRLDNLESDGQGIRSSSVFACSISRPCSQSLGGVVYPSRNCPLGINVFHTD
jgi:hypothetical protein